MCNSEELGEKFKMLQDKHAFDTKKDKHLEVESLQNAA